MPTRRLAAILAADIAGFSGLMERDEEGTHARVRALRKEVIEAALREHTGRLVKTMGDGFLAEFASPVEAVRAAIAIQERTAEREASNAEPLQLRIGINLGDIIVEDDGDVYGDGVNIAARLEQIADPGGILLSGALHDVVDGKVARTIESRGERQVKNIARPLRIFAIGSGRSQAPAEAPELKQEIRFCRAPDGVRLAWAKSGHGPPLVKSANWLNHLQFDWESPIWRHFLVTLGRTSTLYRYDARGNGLSDWEVGEVSLDAFVRDLETVVDAAGLERFPLLGISQGCAVSIAYAVRHPQRVSHLILFGGFAEGWKKYSGPLRERMEAMTALARLGWNSRNPTFRQMFASQLLPDGTKEQLEVNDEHQRNTTTGECAARYLEAVGAFDVADLLERVAAPTLVMHVRDDMIVSSKLGRQLAQGIPGAQFISLPGRNHVLLETDAATQQFFEEIRLFLGR